MDKEEALALTVMLALFGVGIAAAYGWVMNLVLLAHWSDGVGMLIVRVIGVLIAPIGAFLGFMR